ncbi:hypothetical protein [Rubinisphaera margarita]|uniref:hypothetical protein n=1 Tax=Rubinisphaera margarita TaxID=2909586 RepID=UPI001EE7D8FD|nr:hypothetical protein [Rubinisphaera margarita]MCG6157635.1 hypothetical protein [Rubinisphaera margarita]
MTTLFQHLLTSEQLQTLLDELYALVCELNEFKVQQIEQLDRVNQSALFETESRLLAFENLLSETEPVDMLREEIDAATRYLNELKRHITKEGAL